MICGDGTLQRLVVAIFEAGKMFRPPCVEALIDVLIERNVRVLILDPFVKLHLCSENDNGQMDYVMVALKEIAITGKLRHLVDPPQRQGWHKPGSEWRPWRKLHHRRRTRQRDPYGADGQGAGDVWL